MPARGMLLAQQTTTGSAPPLSQHNIIGWLLDWGPSLSSPLLTVSCAASHKKPRPCTILWCQGRIGSACMVGTGTGTGTVKTKSTGTFLLLSLDQHLAIVVSLD